MSVIRGRFGLVGASSNQSHVPFETLCSAVAVSRLRSIHRLHPIGIISSPFTRRNGTPRQGGLVASTRAVITFDIGRVDPTHSLEGIGAFTVVPMSYASSRWTAI